MTLLTSNEGTRVRLLGVRCESSSLVAVVAVVVAMLTFLLLVVSLVSRCCGL